MVVPRTVVPREVVFSEVVQITVLVVMDKSSPASLILSNVVEDVIRADGSETVIAVDPDGSVSLSGVFNAIVAVMVAAFSESGDTDNSILLAGVFVTNGDVIGVV